MPTTAGIVNRPYNVTLQVTDAESGVNRATLLESNFTLTDPASAAVTKTVTLPAADPANPNPNSITFTLSFTPTTVGAYALGLAGGIADADGNPVTAGALETITINA